MKISIVTPTFNSVATLADTVASVQNQTYHDVEHIVVDGGSTDGTIALLQEYQNKGLVRFISEPDNGIYDAMNKGIAMATGEVIGILNADDFFCDAAVLDTVVSVLCDPSIQFCYGDIAYVRQNDPCAVVRVWRAGIFKKYTLAFGWQPPHPSLFVRSTVYQQYGVFDTRFRIAADYEFVLRIFKKYRLYGIYIPKLLVHMRVGGYSSATIARRFQGMREDMRAWKTNGYRVPCTLWLRPLLKLPQFFARFRNKQ